MFLEPRRELRTSSDLKVTTINKEGRSMDLRSVGIDLGITSLHKAAILDNEGRQIGKSISFDSSLQGYNKLLEASLAGKAPQSKVKFVMEPTSTSWIAPSAYLISQGQEVYLIKPQKSADLRKFYNRHSKSDRIDAKVIAKLPIVDPEGLNVLQMSSPEAYSLYRLSLERDQLAKENEGDKKRIKAVFNMAVPKLFQAMGSWQFSCGAKAFLREYTNPFKVVKGGLDSLRVFLQKNNHGPLDPDIPQKIFTACESAGQLYGKLQAEGQIPFYYDQIQRQIRRKLDTIEYRKIQIKQIEKEMEDYYRKVDPQGALRSVKGFGLVIASALIGAMGDVRRFRNAKTVVSYCGLAPRKKQSGNKDLQGMPLTKAGKRIIKKYLHLAGETARQWDPQLANLYFRLRKAGKSHTKAMGSVAAHMSTRAYAILKKVYQMEQGELKADQKIQYELRSLNGNPISSQEARKMIKQKYQIPKKQKGNQPQLVKREDTTKAQQDSQKKEKKAALPDNFCHSRQSQTPHSGQKGSLEQLSILENIVKQKNCQESIKEFLLQNQNVFESTNILLSWLDSGVNAKDLREIILANIILYRRRKIITNQL
jgi:transposase